MDGISPRGRNVLLVEDTLDVQTAMRKLLHLHGHTVACAGTVADALEMLDHGSYHVVLLDLMLPDGDGSEILRHIRAKEYVIKVVVLSGRHNFDYLQQYRPDHCLRKPFNFDQLFEIVGAA